jgi:hypothetical protein
MICHCRRTRIPGCLLLAAALGASGCGSGPNLKPVYPVDGSLFVRGKPAAGAVLTFHPLPLETGRPTALRSRGTVSEDGSFRLTTYNTDDGGPEGEYVVTVYWPGKRSAAAAESGESADLPPDQLGFRFMDPSASTIKVQIKPPQTRLDRINLGP